MKKINIKTKFATVMGIASLLLASAPVITQAQQAFPNRTITMLVGYSAGGPTDNAARVIAEQMSQSLGQPVIVSNKPGASGLVAARDLMSSTPDGYTILLAANAFFTLGPARYETVGYEYAKDFVPIGGVAGYPHVLIVPPKSSFKTVNDLVKHAKANPGKLNSARVGFTNEIAVEWINSLGGVDITQIPYKGAAAVVSDLSSGRIDMALVAPSVAYPLMDGGKARIIATTRSTPTTDARNIPSVSQTPGMEAFDFYIWNGLLAPAGTPAAIVNTLSEALAKAREQPAVANQFSAAYLDVSRMTAAQFTASVNKELEIAKQVVKDANLTLLKQQ